MDPIWFKQGDKAGYALGRGSRFLSMIHTLHMMPGSKKLHSKNPIQAQND